MGMQTDILSTHLTASGTVSANRNRLKAVSYRGNGLDGSLIFKDGGASGTTLLELDVGTSDSFTIYVILPGEGILFQNNIYAALTNVSAITAFYG
jgi:hypothetical protein